MVKDGRSGAVGEAEGALSPLCIEDALKLGRRERGGEKALVSRAQMVEGQKAVSSDPASSVSLIGPSQARAI